MALSEEELERYGRHILLREVGGPGQMALKNAKVLVIGAGGLGSPCLMYLAAAGAGTLGVIDDDKVALSNLQRQIIHTTQRVGMAKTQSAEQSLKALNPNVQVITHPCRLTRDNALEVIAAYDLVADGCDNFATRFLVSDACFLTGKTLVSAAVGQFDGQLSTFKPHENRPDGTPWPSYRCLHSVEPPDGLLPSCEEAGIVGALTGIIGSMQALEVIKEITGAGESLAGRLVMYDGLSASIYQAKLGWNKDNPVNGANGPMQNLDHHGAP